MTIPTATSESDPRDHAVRFPTNSIDVDTSGKTIEADLPTGRGELDRRQRSGMNRRVVRRHLQQESSLPVAQCRQNSYHVFNNVEMFDRAIHDRVIQQSGRVLRVWQA